MDDESLEIVDETGAVLGLAPRSFMHRDPSLLHRVVHVLVVDAGGEILLQRRSLAKDTAPGKWDTSVGGHVAPGEPVAAAVQREMSEELGLAAAETTHLYNWVYRGRTESELVHSHRCRHGGPFAFNPAEIDEVRFWSLAEIGAALGRGAFSRQFEQEFARYLDYLKGRPRA